MKPRTFGEFFKSIVSLLNKTGYDYAITGAMAASYYGLPRTTLDVDFIVQVSRPQLNSFLDELERFGLDVDREMIHSQLRVGYNILSLRDKTSPNRVDFIIETGKLDRRPGKAMGLRSFYQSPEPLILAKLRMIKATLPVERSFKDREDIRQILANSRVNRRRLLRLAKEQSTAAILRDLFKLSQTSPRRGKSPATVRGKYKGLIKLSAELLEEAQERFVNAGRR